nr:hypothetical protein BaRGS_005860 [Batillaria attramentaria]
MDDNGLSDPYVKFRLGNEKYRSKSSQLEISVYDYDVTGRDDFMGRATVDISKLETEVTHNMEVELEDGAGMIRLLMTISGTIGHVASSDLAHFTPDSNQHVQMARRYTHTEYKTLNPEWNKVFTFKVRDIHSVLEVTVYDEDRDKKVEFLGKVAIPLLRVSMIKSGERRWYALKDKKLIHRTKGAILLEMELFYNNVKAAVRTVNPREEKFMEEEPKFKIHLMKRNIDRVSQLVSVFMDTARFLRSCFQWESKPRSLTAFIAFLVIVWNFELYMLPISILLIFLKNLVIAQVIGAFKREPVEDDYFDEDDDEDEEDKDKEEKKTFKEKLQSIQDVCLQVQQAMDTIATLGINKFTKKLRETKRP